MDRSTHTPGPWRKSDTCTDSVVADFDSGHDEEDNVSHYGGHLIAESIRPHNRGLVAAAPTLLDACKAALEEDNGLACAEQLRNAIRVAGEEPAQ